MKDLIGSFKNNPPPIAGWVLRRFKVLMAPKKHTCL
jgi:hypothetical protein